METAALTRLPLRYYWNGSQRTTSLQSLFRVLFLAYWQSHSSWQVNNNFFDTEKSGYFPTWKCINSLLSLWILLNATQLRCKDLPSRFYELVKIQLLYQNKRTFSNLID